MCNGRWPQCPYRTTVKLYGNDGTRLEVFDYGAQSSGWDVDNAGRVYVGGTPNRKCRSDTINVKAWDSSGNLLWAKLDNAATGSFNRTFLGAVPSGGCVSVYRPGGAPGNILYVTRRDVTGAVVWQRSLVPATFSPGSPANPFYVWCNDILAFVMCVPTGVGTGAVIWAFNLATSNPVTSPGSPTNVYSGSGLWATAFYPDLIEGGGYSTSTVGTSSGLSRLSVTGTNIWSRPLPLMVETSVGMVGSKVYLHGYLSGVEILREIHRDTGVILSTTPLTGGPSIPANTSNRAAFGPNRVFIRAAVGAVNSIRCYDFSGAFLWQTTTNPAAVEPRADRVGNVIYSNSRVRDNYPL